MATVIQYAFTGMLLYLRLAVIASLVLYSLPNATLAMHGDASIVSDSVNEAASNLAPVSASEHHQHGALNDFGEHHQVPDDKNCCIDSCVSLSIIAETLQFGTLRSAETLFFMNDGLVFGQLTSLHRPTSIRA